VKRVILLVIVAAVGIAAATSHSSGKTAQTTATKPADPAPATTDHKLASRPASKPCGATHASAHTSCPFAENIYSAYAAFVDAHHSAPEQLEAYSPVTQRQYTVACVVHGALSASATVVCSEGDASVSFGFPKEPEGNVSSEEDSVGSASHATDEQFCDEHHCIGNFTTKDGTVVECEDGTYSHAGGIEGACSDHGGERSGEGGESE
jgi:hypothetical protein